MMGKEMGINIENLIDSVAKVIFAIYIIMISPLVPPSYFKNGIVTFKTHILQQKRITQGINLKVERTGLSGPSTDVPPKITVQANIENTGTEKYILGQNYNAPFLNKIIRVGVLIFFPLYF